MAKDLVRHFLGGDEYRGIEMVGFSSSRQIIEVKAGGPEDPDGSRTAAVLDAYFHAEHIRAFRLILWRRLALFGLVWVLVAVMTSVLSRNAFVEGVAVLVTVGVGAAIAEWRAAEKLSDILQGPAKRVTVVRDLPPLAADADRPN